jgi:enamine deaminase RidA (YjgF/YER057c/UK114 family)
MPLSAGIKVGNLVFLSGQVGLDEKGQIVGKGDIRAQTENAFQEIKTILEAAGSGMDRIVKIITYLTDAANYPAYNEIRCRYLPQPRPATTEVVTKEFVTTPELLIEITVVAVV